MGAGFATGIERKPLLTFSASVAGPASFLQAKEASLLHFI
jgi:hypothetical protein